MSVFAKTDMYFFISAYKRKFQKVYFLTYVRNNVYILLTYVKNNVYNSKYGASTKAH